MAPSVCGVAGKLHLNAGEVNDAVLAAIPSPVRQSPSFQARSPTSARQQHASRQNLQQKAQHCGPGVLPAVVEVDAPELADALAALLEARSKTAALWAAAAGNVDPEVLSKLRHEDAAVRLWAAADLEQQHHDMFWDLLRGHVDHATYTAVAHSAGGGPVSVARRLFSGGETTSPDSRAAGGVAVRRASSVGGLTAGKSASAACTQSKSAQLAMPSSWRASHASGLDGGSPPLHKTLFAGTTRNGTSAARSAPTAAATIGFRGGSGGGKPAASAGGGRQCPSMGRSLPRPPRAPDFAASSCVSPGRDAASDPVGRTGLVRQESPSVRDRVRALELQSSPVSSPVVVSKSPASSSPCGGEVDRYPRCQ
mmetsp:Transcript_34951/g.96620  ORF Transcript_34951/g.96620 Transcript_34951/m.96620 type:complete len:367 (+) Transcript_34951:149-1249(+)